jgi:DNA-binding PadR family transcriptional regulator
MMGSQHHRHGRGRGRGPSHLGVGHIGFGYGRPEGRRARRGDIRAAILALLDEEPMHGYEMIQQIEERTNGIWRPSAGSIYPTLQLLEDEGLISGEEVDGKRRFTLTGEGKTAVESSTEPPPWEQVVDDTGDSTRALVREFQKLMPAFKEVVRSGSDAQKTKAIAVLADARRRLYASLGEDD